MAELVRKGLDARGVPRELIVLARALEQFLERQTANLSRKSKPYPGTVEVLHDLQKKDWGLVVCTNKLEVSARSLLRDL